MNNLDMSEKEQELLGINMYLGKSLNMPKQKERYSQFANDKASAYKDSVNGKWNREVYDGFSDDDDFNAFITKKSRQRKKETKKLRDEGLSKKEAREEAKEIVPVSKVGKAFGKVFKGIGKAVVKVTLGIPRGSYLLLMRLNYRGIADKNAMAMENPQYADAWKKVKAKWEKLGGKVDRLEKAIKEGKNKKPLMCGKKCKSKLANKVGSSFTGADGSFSYHLNREKLNSELIKMYSESRDEESFENVEPTTTSVAVAVSSATAIIGTMAGILSGVKANKNQEKALKDAQAEEERSNKEWEAMATQKQKEELRLAEEQIKAQTNPKNAIMNNPDLTTEEKKEALQVLDESLANEDTSKTKKWLTYAGIGLVILLGIGFIMRNKK
jgi:hypothetical protein